MGKIGDSELIINGDGSVFHLHIRPEELADKVILVGDPGRVELVSSYFSEIESTASSREFRSVTGRYKGTRMTVLSTGIGCDNIDIVMNELDALANVDFRTREVLPEHRCLTILRIGTCGVIQPDIPLGSYIFSRVSVGFDGLLNWYGGRDEVVLKDVEEAFLAHVDWNRYLPTPYFVKAGDALTELFSDCTVPGMTISASGFYGPQCRVVRDCTVPGMTISASGFYGPQCRVVRLPLAMPDLMERLESFRFGDLRFTNFEMEGSAIASLARKLGHEGATICLAIAHRYAKQANADYKSLMGGLVKMCLDRLAQ